MSHDSWVPLNERGEKLSRRSPYHPIWDIVRLIVFFIGLTVVLAVSASEFDHTELATIGTMAGIAGGYEGLMKWLKSRAG